MTERASSPTACPLDRLVAYQSTLRTAVPAEVRGRAFAFYDVLWNAARLVGALLADTIGIRAVYVVGVLLLLAAAAVGFSSELS